MLKELDSSDSFERTYGATIPVNPQTARDVVEQSLGFYKRVGATGPWIGYLVVDADLSRVIGTCGFKGNPTPAGEVEIAYFTFPENEGRGYASAMALEMVRIAQEDTGVRTVIAHTLPERNASVRILEKTGFRSAGEVNDPEDGRVWQWRLNVP